MNDSKDFEGKVVIVTGGASGQGRVAAEMFATRGAKVVVADINEDAAREVGEAIGGFGFKTDVSKESDVKALIDETCKRYGGLDVLFNNAGIGFSATGKFKMASMVDTSEDTFDAVISINLKGAAMACKHAIPHMIARGGGSIINNASINAIAGNPGADAYTAAKGGLVALTRSLAVEWGAKNIRTNCICPGPIETPMIAGAITDEAFRNQLVSSVPLGRLGTSAEVASVAVFLASAGGAYVNGAVIPVDGGWFAK